MPVKIRLQRTGKKDQPLYRMIVTDQHAKAKGKTLTILGAVNLKAKPQNISYDKKALDSWVAKGAQLSQTVRKLLSL